MINTEAKNILIFSFSTFDKNDPKYPGYDSALLLQVFPLHVYYIHEVITSLIDFGKK